MARTSNAADILRRRLANEPGFGKLAAQERAKSSTACIIYEARMAAGLTQAELARLVGTRQSVIARLESADYDGHTLTMLNRIASALSQRVEVRFVPVPGPVRAAP